MSTPPNLPNQPPAPRRHGCLIFLVTIAVLVVVAIILAYYAAVSTAMPYRMIARMIEKANPNVKIEGINGDLKTGVSVSSITWGDDPANRSEIVDLRVKYNGYGAAGKTRRLVVNDAGVRKAHIDLADFPAGTNTTTSQTTTVASGSSSTSVTTTTSGPSVSTTTTTTTTPVFPAATGSNFPASLDSIEVERVDIEDVLITNRLSPEFRISIPKIEWTGFKMTPKSFDPGVLTVDSDRLVLHTTAGRTVPVEGQDATFQKTLTGTAQPALHPSIKQPISFTADLSFLPEGDVRPFHVMAAEGKLEVSESKDGGGAIHARQLDLAGLVDARKLFGDNAADLPSDLVLDAVAATGFADGTGSLKIAGGSFRLGVSTFQIEPVEFTKAGQAGAIVQAVLKTDGGNIVWALPLAKIGDEYHPHFISPGLTPADILARVFAGKPYSELSVVEKQEIDARLPAYFPAEGK